MLLNPPPAGSHAPHLTDKWTPDDCPKQELKECKPISSASDMWFPLDFSRSGPTNIVFADTQSRPSCLDAMEGVTAQRPKSARSGHIRSATRAIPNRASRSNSLGSVPATPTNLWRQVSDPKRQDLTRRPVGPDKHPHATLNSERTRSSPSLNMALEAERNGIACCDAGLSEPALSPASYTHPASLSFVPSVLTQWDQHQRAFSRIWDAQRRNNPYLPLVLSPFNPLRPFMPPMFWKSVSTKNRPFPRVEWNFRRPLPSPTLQTKLRTRKPCDAAAERLSTEAVLAGKLGHHCRVCSKDTLLKRLLLVRHWASSADAVFEAALSLVDENDYEMGDSAALDDSFPNAVLLRDRDDFDDDDGDRPMDEAPLIAGCHPANERYSLSLF